MLGKEAQSRPRPFSSHPGSVLVPRPRGPALPPIPASGCTPWPRAWGRGPAAGLGLPGQRFPRSQGGGGPEQGSLKHKLRVRVSLPGLPVGVTWGVSIYKGVPSPGWKGETEGSLALPAAERRFWQR